MPTPACLKRRAATSLANQLVLGVSGIPINLATFPGQAQTADASAPNNSLFISATTGKLSWKDSAGTVNALY